MFLYVFIKWGLTLPAECASLLWNFESSPKERSLSDKSVEVFAINSQFVNCVRLTWNITGNRCEMCVTNHWRTLKYNWPLNLADTDTDTWQLQWSDNCISAYSIFVLGQTSHLQTTLMWRIVSKVCSTFLKGFQLFFPLFFLFVIFLPPEFQTRRWIPFFGLCVQ